MSEDFLICMNKWGVFFRGRDGTGGPHFELTLLEHRGIPAQD